MAESSMTDVLNHVHTGINAIDALGSVAAECSMSEHGDSLASVLLYLGWKLKADIEELDALICQSGVLARRAANA